MPNEKKFSNVSLKSQCVGTGMIAIYLVIEEELANLRMNNKDNNIENSSFYILYLLKEENNA
ncbi:7957_t:CDS:2 [Ambispora leptoticha]|uniref:7957_t:CDS:1 n=1 Tax=Ambispora leptoticha TaxID=144679 RepID=A0A9N9AT88_9GLOM|nr:7957_t:CDS:2 [Ambispora leptoticha]